MIDDRLKEARKRAKKKKDFYGSLVAYAITIPFLFIINMLTSGTHLWAIWPALGWGVALAFQYWEVFGESHFNADWEERQVQKELEEMERKHGPTEKDMDEHLELRELKREREKQTEWRDDDLV